MPRDTALIEGEVLTHMTPVDPITEARRRFCLELEGDRWQQMFGVLNLDGRRVCAIGAALDFCDTDTSDFCKVSEALILLGISEIEVHWIVDLNDEERLTFPQIADHLRKRWNV